jgi:serine/threonine protein kinase
VDVRVDLYGLGCVAYEALAGRPAVRALNLIEAVQEKLKFVLPPPQDIGRGVSQEMHEFLARALDPRPEKRTIDLDVLAGWAGPVNLPAWRAPSASSDAPTSTVEHRTPTP